MLAQLLSSKPKTNLVNLFLAHPGRAFAFTELRLSSGCSTKLLKITLKELAKMDFVNTTEKNRVLYYQMNRHFALYPELVNLLRKVKQSPKDLLATALAKIKDCKLIVLTGVFVGRPRIETDLLFVGKLSPTKLSQILKLAEKLAEQEVSYTVLSQQEYDYRFSMNDRFVKNVMENYPEIVVDKTKHKHPSKIVYKF